MNDKILQSLDYNDNKYPHKNELITLLKKEFKKEFDQSTDDEDILINKILETKFIAPNIVIRDYPKNLKSSTVDKALIYSVGRNYPDGFSGIHIKKESYRNYYQVEIVDGERGKKFFKRYDHLPSYDELLEDSKFDLIALTNK